MHVRFSKAACLFWQCRNLGGPLKALVWIVIISLFLFFQARAPNIPLRASLFDAAKLDRN